MAPTPRPEAGSYQNEETTNLLSSTDNDVEAPPPLKTVAAHPPASPQKKRHGEEGNGMTAYKWALGTAYMLAMGVCGIVLVALGSSLDDLAENCGYTSTQVGSVFIARGIGAVLGAISSAKLYKWFSGNSVMACILLLLTAVLLYMPFITSVVVLHVAFFFLGLCTAITDTGCQILTRKLHGRDAGPWLGANTVVFGISGALVPLLAYLTDDLFVQYAILATVSVTVGVMLILLPTPDLPGRGAESVLKKPPPVATGARGEAAGQRKGRSSVRDFYTRYKIEFTISAMVFCLIGGKVGATAYLTQYVDDTGVISSSNASLLIMVLWMAITVGRLAGLQDQRHLNLARLYRHSTLLYLGGSLSMLMILLFEDSAFLLWVGVAGYGLFNGPTVGYCYDLNNRITYPSETGMSVVMFGLNFGASVIPYAISGIWDYTGWAQTLIVVTLLSHVIPYPLMLSAKGQHEANRRHERAAARVASTGATAATAVSPSATVAGNGSGGGSRDART